jgi:transposase
MFGADENLDLTALPPAYRAAFAAQQAALSAERAARTRLEGEIRALTDQKQRLEHLVREFRQALYGKRSEKLDADARQLAFEDLEAALAEVEEAKARSTATASPSRPAAKRNLGRLPQELPRLERVIEPASLVCPCGCGAMVRIGEDVTERLDIVPAQFRVIVTIRPKYACPTCQEGVHQAPAPAHLIEGGLPTEASLAHVLVGKFADHLPLYRQAQIYSRQGIELDRSTLAALGGLLTAVPSAIG